MKHVLATAGLACALSGCSGLQVERDLEHARLADQYRASLASAGPFDAPGLCTGAAPLETWTTVTFTAATSVVELPNGVKAEAVCLQVPANARLVQLDSDARGGSTYYQLMAVYPSLMFLDGDYAMLRDYQKPKLSPGEGFFSGLQLTGNLPLDASVAKARHVVVYVHPHSIDGMIDVYTGYQTIPVPYAPYGQLRIRFR